ncbi:MAG: ferritin family protein [Rhizomicrobium sp.]
MPEFSSPFSVLKHDRPLTEAELVRALRFMVCAEYEATQLYEQLAESTDNALAQKVLQDIADEELVHVGEFQRLIKELNPGEAEVYARGEAEVEEEFLGGPAPGAPPPANGVGLGIGSLKS